MALHEIKRNDTRPYFPATLVFDNGSVAPITGASIRFIARRRSDGQTKIDGAAVITDDAAGEVEYRFTTTDTDEAGAFDCEWEVTYADFTVQTFPTRGFDRLKVLGDLA